MFCHRGNFSQWNNLSDRSCGDNFKILNNCRRFLFGIRFSVYDIHARWKKSNSDTFLVSTASDENYKNYKILPLNFSLLLAVGPCCFGDYTRRCSVDAFVLMFRNHCSSEEDPAGCTDRRGSIIPAIVHQILLEYQKITSNCWLGPDKHYRLP